LSRYFFARITEAGHAVGAVDPDRGRTREADAFGSWRRRRIDVADRHVKSAGFEHVDKQRPSGGVVRAVGKPEELDLDHR
jgi:hypothetical protein